MAEQAQDFLDQIKEGKDGKEAAEAVKVSLRDLSKEEHGGQGTAAIFMLDPRKLKVEPGFNPRDMTTPDRVEGLDTLAQNIAANGVQRPLIVRQPDATGLAVITDGERRWRASLIAQDKYGAALKAIPCQLEPKGTDAANRLARVVGVYNNSNPLTTLEQATAVARVIEMGWTIENVARQFGISSMRVYQLLDTEALDPELKKRIRWGEISATLAAEIQAQHGPEIAKDAIGKAVEEKKGQISQTRKAGKSGTKQAKVRPGDVARHLPPLEGKARDPNAADKERLKIYDRSKREFVQVMASYWAKGKVEEVNGRFRVTFAKDAYAQIVDFLRVA